MGLWTVVGPTRKGLKVLSVGGKIGYRYVRVDRTYGAFRGLGKQRQATRAIIFGGNRYRDASAGRSHVLTASSARRLASVLRRATYSR